MFDRNSLARRNLLPMGLISIAVALLAFSAFGGGIPRAGAADLSLDDAALKIGKELVPDLSEPRGGVFAVVGNTSAS